MKRLLQIAGNRKEVRYLLSGVSSEIIEYGSFLLLMLLTNALYFSNTVSFILGIASGFVFHKLWSFAGDQRLKTHRQLIAYTVLATFNLLMINLIVGFLAHTLRVSPAIAKLIGMALTAIWSYAAFNWFIFRTTS